MTKKAEPKLEVEIEKQEMPEPSPAPEPEPEKPAIPAGTEMRHGLLKPIRLKRKR